MGSAKSPTTTGRVLRAPLSVVELRQLFEAAQFSLVGPAGVFDASGNLIWFNLRLGELLGLRVRGQERPTEVQSELVASRWPFFDESHSSQSLFKKIILEILPNDSWDAPAESGVRTYRLRLCSVRLGRRRLRLLSAMSLRPGDLLKDRLSRQTLFRTLSHEIRTSIANLKGYLGMLEEKKSRRDEKDRAVIHERMDHSLKRLDAVVKRLDEFKTELGVDL